MRTKNSKVVLSDRVCQKKSHKKQLMANTHLKEMYTEIVIPDLLRILSNIVLRKLSKNIIDT